MLNRYGELPEGFVNIAFSGGRTSAYMLHRIVNACGGTLPDRVKVVFNNTGFELEETLRFVVRVTEWLGVRIIMVEFCSTEPCKFRVVDHNLASRNGEPFLDLFTTPLLRRDGTVGLRPLPNPAKMGRTCTPNLKVKTTHRYLRSLGWPTSYHSAVGYRADEMDRYNRRMAYQASKKGQAVEGGFTWCPMIPAGVTHEQVLAFWERMPFDLGIEGWQGNCDFCFLKSEWKIKEMMQLYPERIHPWLKLEAMPRDRPNRFRRDRASLAELWDQVQRGDMTARPQDPALICENCTG